MTVSTDTLAPRSFVPWLRCVSASLPLAFLSTQVQAQAVTVTTLAGSAGAGFADGNAATAQFTNPVGVEMDAAGNVLVADQNNHRIRKVDMVGNVTTLAGSGFPGFANGTSIGARFQSPTGLAVDAAGNVLVADLNNHRIRKIDSGGNVATLAGSGVAGFADGTSTAAQFNKPAGVAVDAIGNVIVADVSNHRIRKIAPSGTVTTLAGTGISGFADGPSTTAQFSVPRAVVVDAAGNVLVSDRNNHRIRKIDPGGNVTTLAGSGTPGFANGTGATAQFNNPAELAVDAAGNLFVADQNNSRVRKIDSGGNVTTLAGSGAVGSADGPGDTAQFRFLIGVTVDTAGNVYVADTFNQRIRKITPAASLPALWEWSLVILGLLLLSAGFIMQTK